MSDTSTPNQDSGSFMMLFSLMFLFFIMFNPDLRELLGEIVGIIFFPLIGFNGDWPVLSLTFAGLIMSLISIILRHKYTDWIGMAKSQKIMKALSQETKAARLAGDQKRMEKLLEVQRKRGQEQMLQSSMQMRSTMSSFIFIIAIFTWVALFIGSLDNKTFSIPWATNIYLSRGGPFLKIAPAWIFIYSLVSIPLGQVVQKILKERDFKKRLERLEMVQDNYLQRDPSVENSEDDEEEEQSEDGSNHETPEDLENSEDGLDDAESEEEET